MYLVVGPLNQLCGFVEDDAIEAYQEDLIAVAREDRLPVRVYPIQWPPPYWSTAFLDIGAVSYRLQHLTAMTMKDLRGEESECKVSEDVIPSKVLAALTEGLRMAYQRRGDDSLVRLFREAIEEIEKSGWR
jgi:hypothetical protein